MRPFLLLIAAAAAYGQSLTFEVASVKAAPPPEGGGMRVGTSDGPGSKDPGRWSCMNMSLENLLMTAFDVRPYELTVPSWARTERFNIEAKVPAGATKDDMKGMIENLLVERFGLKYHRESKEMPGYELVVAKGGPKLTESVPVQEADAAAGGPPSGPPKFTMGANGFPEIPPGRAMSIMMNGQGARRAVAETMEALARNLAFQVGRPVVDATGLKGKYDFLLYWTSGQGPAGPPPSGAEGAVPVAGDSGPTIFTAIQQQLGLRLESKKATVQTVVVDKLEKTPSEN